MVKKRKKIKEKPINFGWETEEDRIRRYMRIPAQVKLEALEMLRKLKVKVLFEKTCAGGETGKRTSLRG